MSAELYLISCVKAKLSVSELVRARDLYISPWFKRAHTYVESTKQPWFILSAKYGLVCPNVENPALCENTKFHAQGEAM